MLFSSGFLFFSGKLILTIINFAVILVLARILTPEAFGIIAASQAVITLSQGIIEASFGSFLIQRTELSSQLKRTVITLTILIASIMGMLMFFAAPVIASIINIPEIIDVIRLLLIAFVLTTVSNYSYNMILREMRFKEIVIAEIITIGLIRGGLSIYLAIIGYSYWALVYSIVISTAVWSLLLILLCPMSLKFRFSIREALQVLSFSGAVGVSNLMAMLALKVDNFIVGSFIGKENLGQYNRGYSVIDLTSALLGSVFNTIILTGVSQNRRTQKFSFADERKDFFLAHTSAILCIWPIAITSIVAAPEIILILLGDQWDKTIPLFQVFAVGMFLRMGYKVSSPFNVAYGLVKQEAYRFFLFLIITIIFCYIGAQFSLIIVAFSIIISMFINYVLVTMLTLKYLEVRVLDFVSRVLSTFIPAALIAVITFIICSFLRKFYLPDISIIIIAILIQLTSVYALINLKATKDDTFGTIQKLLSKFIKNRILSRLAKN